MELKHETLWPIMHSRLREYMIVSDWDIDSIASGTGSTSETVAGWLSNKEPTGERLVKLWHLLAAAGCDSPELEELRKSNFLCGQLMTFGLVSIKELQGAIGVTNHQAVLRMLRGSEPMRWHITYEELVELYGDQLQEALTRVPKLNAGSAPPSRSTSTETPSLAVAGRLAQNANTEDEMLLVTAAIVGAALPLVRHLDSDDCSPEQRSHLRHLVGDETMFHLSNHFNNLCSERARQQGRSGKR